MNINNSNNLNYYSTASKNEKNENKKGRKLLKAALVTTTVAAGGYLAYKNIKKGGILKDVADDIYAKGKKIFESLKNGQQKAKNNVQDVIKDKADDVVNAQTKKAAQGLNAAGNTQKVPALPKPPETLALPETSSAVHKVSKKDVIRLADSSSGPVIYVEPKPPLGLPDKGSAIADISYKNVLNNTLMPNPVEVSSHSSVIPVSEKILALPEPPTRLALPETSSAVHKVSKKDVIRLADSSSGPVIYVEPKPLLALPAPKDNAAGSIDAKKISLAYKAAAGIGVAGTFGSVISNDKEETKEILVAGEHGVESSAEESFDEEGNRILTEFVRNEDGDKVIARETFFNKSAPEIPFSELFYNELGELEKSVEHEYSSKNPSLRIASRFYDKNGQYDGKVEFTNKRNNDGIYEVTKKTYFDSQGNNTKVEEKFMVNPETNERFASKTTKLSKNGSKNVTILNDKQLKMFEGSYPSDKFKFTTKETVYKIRYNMDGKEIAMPEKTTETSYDEKINTNNPSKVIIKNAANSVVRTESYVYQDTISDKLHSKTVENGADKSKRTFIYAPDGISPQLEWAYDKNDNVEKGIEYKYSNTEPKVLKTQTVYDSTGAKTETIDYTYNSDFSQVASKIYHNKDNELVKIEKAFSVDAKTGELKPHIITEINKDGKEITTEYDTKDRILTRTIYPLEGSDLPVTTEHYNVYGAIESKVEQFFDKNDADKLIAQKYYGAGGAYEGGTEYQYSKSNPAQLISETYSDSNYEIEGKCEFVHDKNNPELIVRQNHFDYTDGKFVQSGYTNIEYRDNPDEAKIEFSYDNNNIKTSIVSYSKNDLENPREVRIFDDEGRLQTIFGDYKEVNGKRTAHTIYHYKDGVLVNREDRSTEDHDKVVKKYFWKPELDLEGKATGKTKLSHYSQNFPLAKGGYAEQFYMPDTNELLMATLHKPDADYLKDTEFLNSVNSRLENYTLTVPFKSTTQSDVFARGNKDKDGNRTVSGVLDRKGKEPVKFSAYSDAVYGDKDKDVKGNLRFTKHFKDGKILPNDIIYDIFNEPHKESDLIKETVTENGEQVEKFYFYKPILADKDDKWKVLAKERTVKKDGMVHESFRDPKGNLTCLIVSDDKGYVRHIVELDPSSKGKRHFVKTSFDENGKLDRNVIYEGGFDKNGKRKILNKLFY